jgi:hypothetical protein
MPEQQAELIYKYEYCDNNFPGLKEWSEGKSDEQNNSFYAMRELLCFHEDLYGKGETFHLSTQEIDYEVTIKSTIGQGGSKKAVLLDNGKVAMFPNMDVDFFTKTARWWPEAVIKESAMADFLEAIDVPALNREKAIITIPSKHDTNVSYKLPVLISDSFEQYATKGWYVFDNKNPRSTVFSKSECGYWKPELDIWTKPIKTLIYDLWKLSINEVKIGTDSSNLVLIEKETNNLELHYFGFDFGGKYGSSTTPSSVVTQSKPDNAEQACHSMPRSLENIISSFVYYRLEHKNEHINQKLSYKEIDDFANLAGKHFSSCDFIGEALLGHENDSAEF